MIVGHVTKDGAIAGPRLLEHLVDVVLAFDGDRHSGLPDGARHQEPVRAGRRGRLLRAGRAGHRRGARPVRPVHLPARDARARAPASPSRWRADDRCSRSSRPSSRRHRCRVPRRTVHGLDASRVAMVLAVLAAPGSAESGAARTSTSRPSAVPGWSTRPPTWPSRVAVASAAVNADVPAGFVAIGEVGLAGEIRRVPGLDRRLAEAARLGFTDAIVPAEPGDAVRRPGAPAPPGPPSCTPCQPGSPAAPITRRPQRFDGRDEPRPPAHGLDRTAVPDRVPDRLRGDRRRVSVAEERSVPRRMSGPAPATPLRSRRADDQEDAECRSIIRNPRACWPRSRRWRPARRCGRASSGSCAAAPARWSCSATPARCSELCTGGFVLDVPFTPTALRELAKMDGAIVLDTRPVPDRPGRRPADARPGARHHRDRHPAPHGGPGGPADRRPGGHGLGVDVDHLAVRRAASAGSSSTPSTSCRARTRPCRPSSGIGTG